MSQFPKDTAYQPQLPADAASPPAFAGAQSDIARAPPPPPQGRSQPARRVCPRVPVPPGPRHRKTPRYAVRVPCSPPPPPGGGSGQGRGHLGAVPGQGTLTAGRRRAARRGRRRRRSRGGSYRRRQWSAVNREVRKSRLLPCRSAKVRAENAAGVYLTAGRAREALTQPGGPGRGSAEARAPCGGQEI